MRYIWLIILLPVFLLSACDRTDPLYFDANGQPHGSGEKTYNYKAGGVMLRETYVDGKCEFSQWFAPDGRLVHSTDWVNESGEGIYLRQDGSIRCRMTYVNGHAHGTATYYDESGGISKVVEFQNGVELSASATAPEAQP